MRDRLIKLIKDIVHPYFAEAIADCLLENGVILPPCKVGDTVYVLEDFVFACDCRGCEHFEEGWYDDPSKCEKTNSCRKSPECIEVVVRKVTYADILRYMYCGNFGKTVFLTKEEAERALKGEQHEHS